MENPTDLRQFSPAAARNREPILGVLQSVLPQEARVLEFASGTGEHAAHFCAAMPGWDWQPSDPSSPARASIEAWKADFGLPNLRAPLALDATDAWPAGPFDAILAVNLVHISPWAVTPALMAGAARHLNGNGVLVLYGPYRRDGVHTAPSNADFDADLRQRDPAWGIRDLEAVSDAAAACGLVCEQVAEMPANNLTVVFRLTGRSD